jgi:hypothetical protein
MFGSLALLAKQRRELDAAEAAWLREVAAFDRSEDWRVDGHWSAASALRHACHMNQGVARGYIELARKLEQLPEVAGAFDRGEISQRHAVVIAHAHTPERAAEVSNVEAELVDIAREHTPNELGGVVRYLCDAIDGDGGAATDEAEYERRTCYTAKSFHGRYDLQLSGDKLSGEIIETAINAEMARDHQKCDRRSTPQRRFDAVVNLMRAKLDSGALGEVHSVRPHLVTVVHADELPGATPATVDALRAERNRSGYLSTTTLELLLCDCDVSRVIVNGRSEILDVGRATRTVSAAQWKALVVRDQHCRAPGCNQPPDRCQAHHIEFWEHGGPTDLANLKLYCWHHHRRQHIHDAQARARGG